MTATLPRTVGAMETFAPAMRSAILKLREDIRLMNLQKSNNKVATSVEQPQSDYSGELLKRNAAVQSGSQTAVEKHKFDQTLLIVLGSVGSVFVALSIIVLIYCVIRRRKKVRFKSSNEDLLSDFFSQYDKSKSLTSISSATKPDADSNVLDFILPQPPPKRTGFVRKSICGRLNPDLYVQGAGESKSLGFSEGDGLGTLEFSVVYEHETDNLIVAILRVWGLPERVIDENRTALRNPYVRVALLPDQQSHQTKVSRGTLNPLFNECVVFTVDPNAIHQKRLQISVYDHDKKGMRHSMGHVLIPLESIDLQEEIFYRLYLERLEQILHAHLGDMELSLTFIPDAGKIKIGVLNCKDFNEFSKDIEQAMKCHVFIRVQMLRGKRLEKTKETSAVQLGSDIFFNEFMNFSMPMKNVDETHFVFTAVLKTDSDPGVPVGRIELGPYLYARGEELMHWHQAIDNPRKTITMFHMIDSPEVVAKGKTA